MKALILLLLAIIVIQIIKIYYICDNNPGSMTGHIYHVEQHKSCKRFRIHSADGGWNRGESIEFLVKDTLSSYRIIDSALNYGWKVRIYYRGNAIFYYYFTSIQVLDRDPQSRFYNLF